MDIAYLGDSSFRISNKKASLVTDPVNKTSATVVTVSNEDDFDKHNKNKNIKYVVKGSGEYEIEGISVIGIATSNKNTLYVIEIDDVRIAHLGNLNQKLTEKQISAMGDIDVLIIPIGDENTIDAKQAVEITRGIEANIIVPSANQKNEKEVKEFITALGVKVDKSSKLTVKPEGFENGDQSVWQPAPQK